MKPQASDTVPEGPDVCDVCVCKTCDAEHDNRVNAYFHERAISMQRERDEAIRALDELRKAAQ
jgi:hypothetical protein